MGRERKGGREKERDRETGRDLVEGERAGFSPLVVCHQTESWRPESPK